MLYHLALGDAGRRLGQRLGLVGQRVGLPLEKLGDGTMGHPVEPFYRELPAAEAIRVPALREGGADVGRAGVRRRPAATATAWPASI